jgi:hypothetical protein
MEFLNPGPPDGCAGNVFTRSSGPETSTSGSLLSGDMLCRRPIYRIRSPHPAVIPDILMGRILRSQAWD